MVVTDRQLPQPGDIVHVRTRTYLVDAVEVDEHGHTIRLLCLDDDAQGQVLEVVWELELYRQIVGEEAWKNIGARGFDPPRHFGAYVHTLRWNCVTATDPRLFQSPFRAGIKLDAYQLEPLSKALVLPRVNLFIADDTGLGKTIEAGLIASELLLRRRVREIVVACPPSMLRQWKDEMESRFGLAFEILDRDYIERVRQVHGYGVNPWRIYPRLLVSHRLLIDEAYKGPMLAWLDSFRPGSLLILDEAHHAAPASGTRYAIDSKITRAIRDIAGRFEHRLFLSATPHNGHSNSFSALLELLDPQRFMRGVKVLKSNRDAVMVRRLKEDIREVAGGFPKRVVEQVDIDALPDEAPELLLSRLLDEYRGVRQQRVADASKSKQVEAALLISHLQQRLLSSVEAFARTLAVHRRTMERVWSKECESLPGKLTRQQRRLLESASDQDDDWTQTPEEEQARDTDAAVNGATEATAGDAGRADVGRERQLLDEMQQVAERGRGVADARIRWLVDWMQKRMCPGIRQPGAPLQKPAAKWTDLRIIIFTEFDDTRRYIQKMLEAAIAGTEAWQRRIEVFHGPTPEDKREAIKKAFNAPPDKHPVRVLIATDAAREGINLQAHCWNLFHFDVPWNPARLEQRNGRIDRKLQPKDEVFCRYFVYCQRPEDRVIQALVRKTSTIKVELGSLSKVLEDKLSKTIRYGIRHDEVELRAREIEGADVDAVHKESVSDELEESRVRQDALLNQLDTLRNRLESSRRLIRMDAASLREALSCSLELLGAQPLRDMPAADGGPERFVFPNLDQRYGADPTWAATLDTLRVQPDDDKHSFEWRRANPIRPVVFEAPDGIDDEVVQLHLDHRVVRRLLGRFTAQGFVLHDLSRACLTQTTDAIPRVVLLGRLSMYGGSAARLHEELLTVSARWVEPERRRPLLTPYAREAEAKTMELLEEALVPGRRGSVPAKVVERLRASIGRDMEELLPHLKKRGHHAMEDAAKRLEERGRIESREMRNILEGQRRRVREELGRYENRQMQLDLDEEKKQLESYRRYWLRWLETNEDDIEREPARIEELYRVRTSRVEPVGLAYLWPVTG